MADRIRGGYSRHDEHKPELCKGIDCGASWTCNADEAVTAFLRGRGLVWVSARQ